MLREPDIVILEGLNVLQTGVSAGADARFVSDWFDFSIYVDAEEADIEQWYVDRFFAPAGDGVQRRDVVLPSLRRARRRRAGRDRPPGVGEHQPAQPPGEHPAEPDAGRPRAREGRRPRRAVRLRLK